MTMRGLGALVVLLASGMPAWATDSVIYVVPGRHGVPVMINGVDASYRVVEGDIGLSRNVRPHVQVYGGRRISPAPHVGPYFPTLGLPPAYGRLEIETPEERNRPRQAESYSQSWSAESRPPVAQPVQPVPDVFVSPTIPYPPAPYGGRGYR